MCSLIGMSAMLLFSTVHTESMIAGNTHRINQAKISGSAMTIISALFYGLLFFVLSAGLTFVLTAAFFGVPGKENDEY